MNEFPVLSFLIFLPLVGASFIFFATYGSNQAKANLARMVALATTVINFLLSLCLWYGYDNSHTGMQFIEKRIWIDGYNIFYSLGVDGISIFFVLLTTFLLPICILCSWNTISKRPKDYMIAFLMLETFIIGAFCATDFLLFYLFFEASLIPMFIIIGVWGAEDRVYAAFKFFLYTLLGSVFMLVAILYIYFNTGTTDIMELTTILPQYTPEVQRWLWLAFFCSFAVKVPMWPVHTWLPDAHVQAPTAGSVILAGILLKFGGYGFLRFSLPMLPEASHYFADFVIILSIIAVIYTSLVALMQTNMKKLIAYSSVAHMGFVTAGIFVFSQQGIEGAIFQMISHGLVSAALFLCVGVLYDRMHTKDIAFYNGLTHKMPGFAFVFMIMMLASIGLPSTSGFIGEFTIMLAMFQESRIYSALIATGMVLGASYMLWLYARLMFGKMTNAALQEIQDLNCREKAIFIPLVILVIFLGIYPGMITHGISEAALKLQHHMKSEQAQLLDMRSPDVLSLKNIQLTDSN